MNGDHAANRLLGLRDGRSRGTPQARKAMTANDVLWPLRVAPWEGPQGQSCLRQACRFSTKVGRVFKSRLLTRVPLGLWGSWAGSLG